MTAVRKLLPLLGVKALRRKINSVRSFGQLPVHLKFPENHLKLLFRLDKDSKFRSFFQISLFRRSLFFLCRWNRTVSPVSGKDLVLKLLQDLAAHLI